jgi:PhnB protein
VIKGAAKAIDYYKKVFGATVVVAHGRSRRPGRPCRIANRRLAHHAGGRKSSDGIPQRREYRIVSGEPVCVPPDCDEVVAKAAAEGAKILKPVADQFYGDRSGFIQDPFGHLWGIATHKEDVSPEEMEEREESDAGRLTGRREAQLAHSSEARSELELAKDYEPVSQRLLRGRY